MNLTKAQQIALLKISAAEKLRRPGDLSVPRITAEESQASTHRTKPDTWTILYRAGLILHDGWFVSLTDAGRAALSSAKTK